VFWQKAEPAVSDKSAAAIRIEGFIKGVVRGFLIINQAGFVP
jgi:hypothetical protein